MMEVSDIKILDYTYELPAQKIAMFPLEQRDAAKLLLYKDGQISETVFRHVGNHLPEDALLVSNNTKVVHARIECYKATGGKIEIFCLEPFGSVGDYSVALAQTERVLWKCFVGGAAKWKGETLQKELTINGNIVTLYVKLEQQNINDYTIKFWWNPSQYSFAEILLHAGRLPLPPYIKRAANEVDENTYQTMFALHEGSVAAPTAGLHFTPEVMLSLTEKNIQATTVTLHVGAGTFQPVKAPTMATHNMHAEYVDVTLEALEEIYKAAHVTAVGTTSLRTLESLYWLGVKLLLAPSPSTPEIMQWDVYQKTLVEKNFTKREALLGLITWMKQYNHSHLFTKTQLLIAPGYRFRVVQSLITNFHQPQSTLLLIVAAAVGAQWKEIYQYALANDFRFLSYGDANLIFIAPEAQPQNFGN